MTLYALVENDAITAAPVDVPFTGGRNQATGQWVCPVNGLANGSVAEQEACGYFVITEVAPPTPAVGQVLVGPSYALVEGRPVQQWSLRAETTEETQMRLRESTRLTLRDVQRARTFINAVTAFNALANPSNAEFRNHLRIVGTAAAELLKFTIAGELLDP
jgi:hypothetical protein